MIEPEPDEVPMSILAMLGPELGFDHPPKLSVELYDPGSNTPPGLEQQKLECLPYTALRSGSFEKVERGGYFESSALQQSRRLNAKAAPFMPVAPPPLPNPPSVINNGDNRGAEGFKRQIASIIRDAMKIIEQAKEVFRITLHEDDRGEWTAVIYPRGQQSEDPAKAMEVLTALAKDTIMATANKSKHIYLIGYCASWTKARPCGFDATFAAMHNAGFACWHLYKKGFCRHESQCRKQHPQFLVPIHVIISVVQLQGSTLWERMFKKQLLAFAKDLMTMIQASPYVESVEAYRDDDLSGWTVEVVARDNMVIPNGRSVRECLQADLQDAFFQASSNSESLYVVGYESLCFFKLPNGFITFLGNMQNEGKACWNMYAKGMCQMGAGCRWYHPSCFMPFGIVVKDSELMISI